jgi:hypothetical protein
LLGRKTRLHSSLTHVAIRTIALNLISGAMWIRLRALQVREGSAGDDELQECNAQLLPLSPFSRKSAHFCEVTKHLEMRASHHIAT